MELKTITSHDSLGSNHEVYTKAMLQYLKEEHKHVYKGSELNTSEWTTIATPKDTPHQLNGESP